MGPTYTTGPVLRQCYKIDNVRRQDHVALNTGRSSDHVALTHCNEIDNVWRQEKYLHAALLAWVGFASIWALDGSGLQTHSEYVVCDDR